MKRARALLWVGVALAIVLAATLLLFRGSPGGQQAPSSSEVQSNFGGPFTLVGADGKPFSSQALEGKPYAIYFGFTRCGDVCPTTLSRLARLRREAARDQSLNIVFVTIDPTHDGPKEVGQYAELFGAPIIGLTGSQAQIDQVKKQYRDLRPASAARGDGQADGAYRDRLAVRPRREVRRNDRPRRAR